MELQTKARLASAALLICCLIPGVGMLVLPEQEAAANQALAPMPALTLPDGSVNPDVLQQATDYIADHFAFRQELITAGAALQASVFHTSAEDSVLLGRDGWLFYRETVPGYLHTEPLSDRALYSAAHTLALLREYIESHGAQFLFTVAPNKASLYPEFLPRVGTPLPGKDDIDRLLPLLAQENVPYANLFAAFRAQPDILYYQQDSHWNTRGAALAHDVLTEALGKDDVSPFFDGAWKPVRNHRSDLYEMLYPAGNDLEEDASFDRGFTFSYDSEPRSAEDQRIQTSCPGKSGKLLMFRDSFGNSLHSFLADSYGHATFSRAMPYQMALLGETGADTVVIELVERNLDWLTVRAPIFPAPERGLQGSPPQGDAAASITAQNDGQLQGYLRLEGSLSDADTNSPLYIQLGESLYEASPVGSAENRLPFTLYVPENAVTSNARVLYLSNDTLYQTALVPITMPAK